MLEFVRDDAVVRRFVRAPGVRVEPVGLAWAGYSGLSGETHLLNDESAAIVDALDEAIPRSLAEVCRSLADDCGVPALEIERSIGAAWRQLDASGLIREAFSAGPA